MMQYETVILEMLSRIKNLENEVEELKSMIENNDTFNGCEEKGRKNITVTDEMLDECYLFGKKAYENTYSDVRSFAQTVSKETGMNENNAFMTITAVKFLLDGEVYKRALSAKALDKYLDNILNDYGKTALSRALDSMDKHIEYRHSKNHNVDALIKVCNKYKAVLEEN